MPYYEYRCAANGRTVEVRHGMGALLTTWGEVAAAAGEEVGSTPADAPVERLMSMAAVGHTAGGAASAAPALSPGFKGCGPGCGCAH
jgi:predicted nucleic acid-binding Zn ribbon protein